METARYADFSMASSTLNTALLASVGEKNRNHLKTTFPALKLYMLSPREIVDTCVPSTVSLQAMTSASSETPCLEL
jgi:hypothetical protein